VIENAKLIQLEQTLTELSIESSENLPAYAAEIFNTSNHFYSLVPPYPYGDFTRNRKLQSKISSNRQTRPNSELWTDIDENDGVIEQNQMEIAKKAYTQIVLRCDKPNTIFIGDVAKNNSRALREKYDSDSIMNKVHILGNALSMRLANDDALINHIDTMRTAYHSLEGHGIKLPELVSVANLMISLPKDYDGVIAPFFHIHDAKLKFENVASALLGEQKRRKFLIFNNQSDEIAVSTSKQLNRNQRKKVFSCSNCGKRGHLAADCYVPKKPQAQQKDSRQKTTRSTNNVTQDDCKDDSMYAKHHSFVPVEIDEPETPKKVKSIIVKVENSNSQVSTHEVEAEFSAKQVKSRFARKRHSDAPPTPVKYPERMSNGLSQKSSPNDFEMEMETNEEDLNFINNELKNYPSAFNSNYPNKTKISGWIVDSGASLHMTHNRSLFQSFTESKGGKVKIADGNFIKIEGYGTVKVMIKTRSEPIALVLKQVAYVPMLHVNLMSVTKLDKNHFATLFENGKCQIKIHNEFIQLAIFKDNNYVVTEEFCQSAHLCIHDWHRRLAHRNLRDIKHLSEFGLKFTRCSCTSQCDACIKREPANLSFPKESRKPEKPLDTIVADICGALRVTSHGGSNYFLTLTDLYSDYTEVKFLRNKSDAKQHIVKFVMFLKNQLADKPKTFRSDKWGEFMDKELQTFLLSKGIKIELTAPNSPQQNRVAERKNRTLNDAVQTLLICSQLPECLWAEAMNNVIYTQNRIVRKGKSAAPIELFFNKNARASFIDFGSPVYVNIHKQGRGKFDPRAEVMKFLSVDDNTKGFRLWTGKRVIVECNIRSKECDKNVSYQYPITDKPILKESQNALEEKSSGLRRSERIKEQKTLNNASFIQNSPERN
jgi:gag-polypeptide of LTR copia-type/Integrase core domain